MKQESVETLNDLIKINNDRIAGYERAIDESKGLDTDLKSIFSDMISESRQYSQELSAMVAQTGSDVADGTTASGKIYRAWMDVKATFTGRDRTAVLASCEFGEDAAQKAYKSALEDAAELDGTVVELITKQKAALKQSHDKIKALRDSSK